MDRTTGLAVVGVLLVAAVGQALQCYKCNLGLWNLCVTTNVTCNATERCFSGVGKAANVADISMKGCLQSNDCDQDSTVQFFPNKTIFTMRKTCCGTDLCNAAAPLQLPVTLVVTVVTAVQFAGVLL